MRPSPYIVNRKISIIFLPFEISLVMHFDQGFDLSYWQTL